MRTIVALGILCIFILFVTGCVSEYDSCRDSCLKDKYGCEHNSSRSELGDIHYDCCKYIGGKSCEIISEKEAKLKCYEECKGVR